MNCGGVARFPKYCGRNKIKIIHTKNRLPKMFQMDEFCNSKDLSSNRKISRFLHLMTSKWDEIHTDPDVFRYKLLNIQERIVDGKYILQLNPDRSINRRTPEQIDDICQPFDSNKFNFTKASPKELIFSIRENVEDPDLHSLLVNVSPISQYHTLLCPSINKLLPQVATADSLQLAIDIMFLAQDRDLRIGFNSLCALASVNHLHFHLLMEKNVLSVETVKWIHLKGSIYCLDENYPVPAFCFKTKQHTTSLLAKEIYKLVEFLLKRSIAHNILITRRSSADDLVSVIVWPRKSTSGVKQLTAFNVAVCELSGWFPVFSAEAFESLQTEDLEKELTKWKLDNFEELCEKVQSIY